MASLGHVIIGMAGARVWPNAAAPTPPTRRRLVGTMGALALLSLLPDADVIAFKFGIPYAHPFGHRGASHSIAFALICGALAYAAARLSTWNADRVRIAVVVFAIVVSHPLLDAMTDGGLGVALFWPISDARVFAPWRPLPVAPIGARFFTTSAGWSVAAREFLFFVPPLLYALWPRRQASGG